MTEPGRRNRDERHEWRLVVFSSDCDEDGNCPFCEIDYAECSCPGPCQDEEYVYAEIDGVLLARARGPGK